MDKSCPNDETKPKPTGRAKRSPDYPMLSALSEHFKPAPLTRLDIDRALSGIGVGKTEKLSHGAFRLLHFLTTRLDVRKLAEGKTCVWPGAALCADRLGVVEGTIRRYKLELETKKYIDRRYNELNQPLREEAINLAPFLLAAPGIIRDIEAADKKRATEREKLRRTPDQNSDPDMRTWARGSAHQNSTLNQTESCLDLVVEKGSPNGEIDHIASDVTSPKTEDRDREIIQEALAISPKLRKSLLGEEKTITPGEAVRRLYVALPELFPNSAGTNLGHTLRWAAQKYGIRVFEFIVVCIEDPKIRCPHKYFGKLVTSSAEIDLTTNLSRIRALNPPPVRVDLPKSRFGQMVANALLKTITVAKYSSWFNPAKVAFRHQGEALLIETTSHVIAERIETEFWPRILTAAKSIGLTTVRVRPVDALPEAEEGPSCGATRTAGDDARQVLQILSKDDMTTAMVA